MTHDDVRDLSAEYVLGALDAASRAAVDAHLAACAACRAILEEDARALDALGRGVDLTPAPAALRDRVLRAAVEAGRDESHVSARKSAAPRRLPWILAAAAALVALLAGWQLLALRGERETLNAVAAEQQRSLAVLAAADLVRFDLRGDAAPARARAFWSHRHGMVFTAEGLAPVPAGRTYQLWVISGGKPISAGVFEATATGEARVVMPTPVTLTQVDAVAVTVEPAGGLDAPSTAPILAGTPGI